MQSSSQIVTVNKPTPNILQAGCPSCYPTNSIKALKGKVSHYIDFLTPSSLEVSSLIFDHQRLLVTLGAGCQAFHQLSDASTTVVNQRLFYNM